MTNRLPKQMILKVQLPQFTRESDPPILVYDRSRKYLRQFPASQFSFDVIEAMKKKRAPKAFWRATLHDGTLTFEEMLNEQGW